MATETLLPTPAFVRMLIALLLLCAPAPAEEVDVPPPPAATRPPAEGLRDLLARAAADPQADGEDLSARIVALGVDVLPALFTEVPALLDDFRRRDVFESAMAAFRRFRPEEVRSLLGAETAEEKGADAEDTALLILGALADGGSAEITAGICARRGDDALRSPSFSGAVVGAFASAFGADGAACAGAEKIWADGGAELRRAVLDAVERCGGPGATAALLRIIRTDLHASGEAIRRLLRMPILGVEAIPLRLDLMVQDLAESEDPQLRALTAGLLSRLHLGERIDLLIGLLADTDGEVSLAARQATEEMTGVRVSGGPESVESWLEVEETWLTGSLADELDQLRLADPVATCEILGKLSRHKLHRARFVTEVAACLGAESPDVRRAAARALSRLAAPESTGALLPALADEDEGVRSLAHQALVRTTRIHPPPPPEGWQEALRMPAGPQPRLADTRRIR
jgi:HEAT repeat protein